MASEYESAVVQLQDGRELYLRNVEWGTALRGRCNDSRKNVIVESSNIALVIPDVSVNEYNRHFEGEENLLVTGSWRDEQ